MIAGPRKVGVRKCDPAVRMTPQNVPWRRPAARAKEEARLRIHVCVTPAVEDDPRNIPARIESAGREHVAELLAEHPLILREGRTQQLRPPPPSPLPPARPGAGAEHCDGAHTTG